jgi:hypothetical protein
MTDRYTRAVLTVIAAALVIIAARGQFESVAYAADDIKCTVEGPIEIRSFGDDLTVKIANKIKVEVDQAYASAGSSSSSPLHIKMRD